ncbi:DUF6082 family protein [Streptomyces sp. NPDC053367]|uniref:DUF6082 family protein n=1 Tax=Streptomyces sp. NPDC053367 TaxID=3365700 RepID=UPI0037D54752
MARCRWSFLQLPFRLGIPGKAALRDMFDGHFQGEIAREHWLTGGPGWRVSAELSAGPRRRQFVEIADQCHARAIAGGPPVPAAQYFEAAPSRVRMLVGRDPEEPAVPPPPASSPGLAAAPGARGMRGSRSRWRAWRAGRVGGSAVQVAAG